MINIENNVSKIFKSGQLDDIPKAVIAKLDNMGDEFLELLVG